jgi:cyclic-di-GMP-binding protein
MQTLPTHPKNVLLPAKSLVAGTGFEPVKLSRRIYSPLPLAARATCRQTGYNERVDRAQTAITPAITREGTDRMADSSFDIVSKVDHQEVDNALNQAAKELATRFDFRGTDTKIAWKGDEAVELTSSTEERVKAAVDVFKEKLIRRDISMKAFDAGEPQASGKTYKVTGAIKQGISSENAKKITKLIRDEGPKNVKTQIQGDEVRVTSKKRDDLQAVIAMLKNADLDVALQFVNYR